MKNELSLNKNNHNAVINFDIGLSTIQQYNNINGKWCKLDMPIFSIFPRHLTCRWV